MVVAVGILPAESDKHVVYVLGVARRYVGADLFSPIDAIGRDLAGTPGWARHTHDAPVHLRCLPHETGEDGEVRIVPVRAAGDVLGDVQEDALLDIGGKRRIGLVVVEVEEVGDVTTGDDRRHFVSV
jgi:hypothetical protein